jgi:hypothetical protein
VLHGTMESRGFPLKACCEIHKEKAVFVEKVTMWVHSVVMSKQILRG